MCDSKNLAALQCEFDEALKKTAQLERSTKCQARKAIKIKCQLEQMQKEACAKAEEERKAKQLCKCQKACVKRIEKCFRGQHGPDIECKKKRALKKCVRECVDRAECKYIFKQLRKARKERESKKCHGNRSEKSCCAEQEACDECNKPRKKKSDECCETNENENCGNTECHSCESEDEESDSDVDCFCG